MAIFEMNGPGESGDERAVAVPVVRKVRRERRSWTPEEKLAIIAEVDRTGESVAAVARRHDMNANQLFNWMDRAELGVLGRRRSRGRKRKSAPDTPKQAAAGAEQAFVDLGVFTREEMAQAFVGGAVLEVALPNGLLVRLPASAEPEVLAQAVRALKVI
jgi:transposase-like protein